MPGLTTLSLDQLPLEVLYIIFYYIDIPDILRIRRVSQDLNQVTHCREVWANAYRTANLVRPPGPFPSQSADDLESALVTSLRVHRNISYDGCITNTERSALWVREIRCPKIPRNGPTKFVSGRFLFIPFSEEVHCYDLQHKESLGSRIIFRRSDGIPKSFYCVSAIDVEGRPFACLVLSEAMQTMRRISIYCLKSEQTLDLIHQFEVDNFHVNEVTLGPRVIIIRGVLGHFAHADRLLVALDVHTRMQFHFDTSIPPTWEAAKPFRRGILKCISTSTHVVLARSANIKGVGWSTFFQAFALPIPAHCPMTTTTPTTLRPSHHGISNQRTGVPVGGNLLLHDTVSDPSTQDVLIVIKLANIPSSRRDVSPCGTLRLSAMDTPGEVGTITYQSHGPRTGRGEVYFLDYPSYNGTGRVFYTDGTGLVTAMEYDLDIRGERGLNSVEYPVLRFQTSLALLDHDPFSGRICLERQKEGDTVLEIWDFSI